MRPLTLSWLVSTATIFVMFLCVLFYDAGKSGGMGAPCSLRTQLMGMALAGWLLSGIILLAQYHMDPRNRHER